MGKYLYRNELDLIRPYVPGKPIEQVKKEYGIEKIEKLASNENPLGPSPKALEAIRNELLSINIYPDSSASVLRETIAEEYSLKANNVIVGNGGEHILQVIAQTFINAGDEAIMADKTFDLYESTVTLLGGTAVKVPLKNYMHDLEEFINRINEKTKLIYVCNPNNPIGNIATKNSVEYLISNVPNDIVIVFDEAYYDYARINENYPDSIDILRRRPNTVILRTFSKIAGIAAMRVGFALSSPEIIEQMSKVRGVFSVNRLAQVAAAAALKDYEHIHNTVKLNYESMRFMEEYFKIMNLEYIKSNANFVFVNLNMDSRDVFESFQEKGIIIRPGYLWGMDSWIRVSTGTMEQTKLFIEKLDEIL